MTKRWFVCLLLLLFIAGCQQMPRINGDIPMDAANLEQWKINGRIGYSNAQKGGSASVVWQQHQPQHGQLDLSGPIGIGHAVIRYQPNHAELDTGKQHVEAANATALAYQVTGMLLPIEALSWWVRGLAWPAARIDAFQLSDNHQLIELQQAGWTLQFDRHQTHNTLTLPGRIKATQDDSRFTLIISAWNLSTEP